MATGGAVPQVREMVVFRLGNQRYALPIEAVQEIQQLVAMSDVPESVQGVIGMVNLRGEVIPAVDLRLMLGMKAEPYELQTPMVIARLSGSLVALVVDEVDDVLQIPAGGLQEPDELLELAERLLGVCQLEGGLVFLLDPDRLVVKAPQPKAPAKRRSRKKAE
jgi:purine-binding chemotaxis protein CheW